MEMPLGSEPDSVQWLYEFLSSLRPQIQKQGLSLKTLGEFDTILVGLQAEATASKTVVPVAAALVGAWCHKPHPKPKDKA
jgi:hypothetical protein